ncbi:3-oxoacyl-ACP reductase FabG [Dinghuibacter silviterrae]|uniref:3-oxoacyl-[acyl-carrier protein] reductase n=1 Tax=Dinghuibacter silviterrae TaxID=1539049 RepID=A0A4R8DYK0_9BACT|nr:3-oxoacyl-ACP reductase FabG [Dinghuibacter silviterrae]TDX02291.1 3-oxoacyl-[acyl-carrier protein] reductase [Dinghuibacter silviterrae]
MKCTLVTGGSRGIGRAICVKLAAEGGHHILINYRSNEAEALNTLELVRATGATGEILKFDVGNKEEVTSVLGGWIESHPDHFIEVLVNNAGIKDDGLMMWMKDDQWDSVINASLHGFFFVTRLVINPMLLKRYGRIINIVSLSGLKGVPGQANYSAAKGGVIGATKALAQEVAKRNITVNAVAPGFIKTDMTEKVSEKDMKMLIPMGRFGNPEEIAHVVAFLASPGASYLTAEVINVNGGMYS